METIDKVFAVILGLCAGTLFLLCLSFVIVALRV